MRSTAAGGAPSPLLSAWGQVTAEELVELLFPDQRHLPATLQKRDDDKSAQHLGGGGWTLAHPQRHARSPEESIWLGSPQVRVALLDGGEVLAVSAGSRLVLATFDDSSGVPHVVKGLCEEGEEVASVEWLAFAGTPGAKAPQEPLWHRRGGFACLAVGTSRGAFCICTVEGRLLFRQALHSGPLLRIRVFSGAENERVVAVFSNALVCIDAVELQALLRRRLQGQPEPASSVSSGASQQGNRTKGDRPGQPPLLAVKKLGLPSRWGHVGDAAQVAQFVPSVFEVQNRAEDMCFVAIGRDPAISFLRASTGGHLSASVIAARISTFVSTAASSIMSTAAARIPGFGMWRNSAAPGGTNPSLSAAVSQVPSIGPWAATHVRAAEALVLPPGSVGSQAEARMLDPGTPVEVESVVRDAPRVGADLAVAPRGPLLAVSDSLGRVLLLDASTLAVIRIWKGYREAQCSFLEAPESDTPGAERHLLYLAILAPRRGAVEIWRMRYGPRLAVVRCGPDCRLLLPSPCLAAGDYRGIRPDMPQSSGTFLLSGQSGELLQLSATLWRRLGGGLVLEEGGLPSQQALFQCLCDLLRLRSGSAAAAVAMLARIPAEQGGLEEPPQEEQVVICRLMAALSSPLRQAKALELLLEFRPLAPPSLLIAATWQVVNALSRACSEGAGNQIAGALSQSSRTMPLRQRPGKGALPSGNSSDLEEVPEESGEDAREILAVKEAWQVEEEQKKVAILKERLGVLIWRQLLQEVYCEVTNRDLEGRKQDVQVGAPHSSTSREHHQLSIALQRSRELRHLPPREWGFEKTSLEKWCSNSDIKWWHEAGLNDSAPETMPSPSARSSLARAGNPQAGIPDTSSPGLAHSPGSNSFSGAAPSPGGVPLHRTAADSWDEMPTPALQSQESFRVATLQRSGSSRSSQQAPLSCSQFVQAFCYDWKQDPTAISAPDGSPVTLPGQQRRGLWLRSGEEEEDTAGRSSPQIASLSQMLFSGLLQGPPGLGLCRSIFPLLPLPGSDWQRLFLAWFEDAPFPAVLDLPLSELLSLLQDFACESKELTNGEPPLGKPDHVVEPYARRPRRGRGSNQAGSSVVPGDISPNLSSRPGGRYVQFYEWCRRSISTGRALFLARLCAAASEEESKRGRHLVATHDEAFLKDYMSWLQQGVVDWKCLVTEVENAYWVGLAVRQVIIHCPTESGQSLPSAAELATFPIVTWMAKLQLLAAPRVNQVAALYKSILAEAGAASRAGGNSGTSSFEFSTLAGPPSVSSSAAQSFLILRELLLRFPNDWNEDVLAAHCCLELCNQWAAAAGGASPGGAGGDQLLAAQEHASILSLVALKGGMVVSTWTATFGPRAAVIVSLVRALGRAPTDEECAQAFGSPQATALQLASLVGACEQHLALLYDSVLLAEAGAAYTPASTALEGFVAACDATCCEAIAEFKRRPPTGNRVHAYMLLLRVVGVALALSLGKGSANLDGIFPANILAAFPSLQQEAGAQKNIGAAAVEARVAFLRAALTAQQRLPDVSLSKEPGSEGLAALRYVRASVYGLATDLGIARAHLQDPLLKESTADQ